MSEASSDSPLESLAGIHRSQRVRIERIHYQVLKDLCYAVGFTEGQTVRCKSVTTKALLLETTNGRTLVLDPS